MLEHKTLLRDCYGIEIRKSKPRNWRELTSEPLRETVKAVQCRYYSWLLWFPKKRLLRIDGGIYASLDSVEASKEHKSAERA